MDSVPPSTVPDAVRVDKRPTSTNFRGQKLGKGNQMNFNWIYFNLPMSPPLGIPGSPGYVEPGAISEEGKSFLKDLTKSLNSIKGVKQIDVEINVNPGSGSLTYFNNTIAENVEKNGSKYLKQIGLKGVNEGSSLKNGTIINAR